MSEDKREIKQEQKSVYAEQGNVYVTYASDRKIPKILSTSLPFFLPPEFFLGRDADLEAVHKKLFSGENLLLLINGEGGIGKTTFAAKYWQRYESQYQHLAWVFTGSSLLDALLTLAPKLQVSFPEAMPSEQRLSEMLPVMAGLDKPCLLVLDNANDAGDIGRYYQDLHACANFHILLTSRITSFEQAATYPIPPLNEIDALALFKKHYPGHRDNDDELLRAIRNAVGGNTLVLELLAKNLAAINCDEVFYPLAGLLRDLQQKGLFRLAQEKKINVAGKQNRHGFIETRPTDVLAALYDEVEMVKPLNEQEKRLLSNLSVLPAENIAYGWLKALLVPEDAQAFSGILSDLAQRGWLEKSSSSSGGTQYKVSPVVQEITRHKNQPQLLEHVGILINTLIEKLDYEPGTGHFVNASYADAAVYANYAASVVSHVAEVDGGLTVLCERIGSYHQTTGNLGSALSFYQEYFRLEKELHDADPQDVDFKNGLAISYSKLGNTHTALGNLDRALGFFEQYNQLTQELYEAYPNNVSFKNGLAISYSKLGDTHTALGNLDRALGFFEQCNQLTQELYEAYPDNVSFKNGLAVSYERLGDTHTALGDLDRALGFFEDETGLFKELYEAYPNNVSFKNGLAISYSQLGRFYRDQKADMAKAKQNFEQCYRLWQELAESYPAYVEFGNNLAWAKNA